MPPKTKLLLNEIQNFVLQIIMSLIHLVSVAYLDEERYLPIRWVQELVLGEILNKKNRNGATQKGGCQDHASSCLHSFSQPILHHEVERVHVVSHQLLERLQGKSPLTLGT